MFSLLQETIAEYKEAGKPRAVLKTPTYPLKNEVQIRRFGNTTLKNAKSIMVHVTALLQFRHPVKKMLDKNHTLLAVKQKHRVHKLKVALCVQGTSTKRGSGKQKNVFSGKSLQENSTARKDWSPFKSRLTSRQFYLLTAYKGKKKSYRSTYKTNDLPQLNL